MRSLCHRLTRGWPWLGSVSRACGAGFLAALWVGLVLAQVGVFRAWGALLAGVVVGGGVWRILHRQQAEVTVMPKSPRGLLAAGALALLSLAFTMPPSEFLLGGWDPGVYIHTAAMLAREGGLQPEVPDLAVLDAANRKLIGRQGQGAWEPFLGMRMLPNGRLSPQFYHLYPVLMALLWPFGGVKAALQVNPLLNALSILLMYLWACRWVRPRWAFGAALLLALNPAQVWQAGFGTAELLAQSLLLIGLVATDRALSGEAHSRLDAFAAGAAFGLMMLTKYEAMLFVVPFAVCLLPGLRDRSHRRPLILLLGMLALMGLHVCVHQKWFSPLYYPRGNWVLPGLAAAGLVALPTAAIAWLNPRLTADDPPAAAARMRRLRLVAVAGFACWVCFAGYVRPHLTVDGRVLTLVTRWLPGAKDTDWFAFLAGRNARNFWYLQALFGTAGLWAALAGVGWLLARRRAIWQTAWLMASLGVLVALMTQISHEPFMMFVARRLVPVILPLLCLGGAVLCDRCDWLLRKYPLRGVLAGLSVLAGSLAGTLGGTIILAANREWPGLAAWFDQLADEIPRGAAVYSDAPGFAAPLRFIYGIPAYDVRTMESDSRSDPMPMVLHRAERQPVFWLTQDPLPETVAPHAEPTASLTLRSHMLGTTRHTVPRYIRPRGGVFTLFRIVPPVGPPNA